MSLRSLNARFGARARVWLAALLLTVLIWAAARIAAVMVFDVALAPGRWWLDLAAAIGMGLLLFALSRRLLWFGIALGLLFGLLYLGNAAKIAFLGAPMLPDDAYALPALIEVLPAWARFVVLLPPLLFVALLAWNFHPRWPAAGAALALGLIAAAIVFAPQRVIGFLDPLTGYIEWNQAGTYQMRGPVLHTMQETARFVADRPIVPDAATVEEAVVRATPRPLELAAASEFRPRNIHVIVEESFWDAALLTKAGIEEDPFDPVFRALWESVGSPRALSPTFGGQTANAEFEFLCGFPVTERAVKFEREFSNSAPCLPQILGALGYRTVASHPNTPAFWNRTNAYRRAGFETYWAAPDFVLDDLVGPFLSDASLFRQVDEKLAASDDPRPVFNYVLTFQGHWLYDVNERYPELIETASGASEVGPFVATMRHKTVALLAHLETILAADPEALIVLFGDHPPFLGQHFGAYAESGLLLPDEGAFDAAMLETYAATPLLVIDGWRGPVDTGTMPIYALPQLVLDLIGYRGMTALDLTREPEGITIRPIKDRTLVIGEDGVPTHCMPGHRHPDCRRANAWLSNVMLLGDDIFLGDQHVLGLLPPIEPPAMPETAPMQAAAPATSAAGTEPVVLPQP
ncbi:MAG: LTA synthase family protein [Rhodospirillaceae bacterium]|nr:LTA synthase family protein [Rhodospirillaceae bacterium]